MASKILFIYRYGSASFQIKTADKLYLNAHTYVYININTETYGLYNLCSYYRITHSPV